MKKNILNIFIGISMFLAIGLVSSATNNYQYGMMGMMNGSYGYGMMYFG